MRKRKKRVAIFLILLLVCLGILGFLYINKARFFSNTNKSLDLISGYGYTISKRDSKLMKDHFELLKAELSKKKIDYEKYAEYLSELFIIDLYTIDNKDSKYDVGGIEYIYPDHIDNYKLKVTDTLYKYVEAKENRKQKLPIVNSIELLDLKETKFEFNEEDYDGYEVSLSWNYAKDLGYDSCGAVTLIKKDNKLYVAKYVPEVEEW